MSTVVIPSWAVNVQLESFSLLVQCPDTLPAFECGCCWWSISLPTSKINTLTNLSCGYKVTVVTVMEHLNCNESEMVSVFGMRWISAIERELPYARCQQFYICKLATISVLDFNKKSKSVTPYWNNLVTDNYQSRTWLCLQKLMIKKSHTSIFKIKRRNKIDFPKPKLITIKKPASKVILDQNPKFDKTNTMKT